ncbi:hypothetical protein MIMGU_mgv1a017378mg [Erythranthe guttata]|uniref:Uncharacterized protein n=1 Tax=Erythranthe guttata TaxID=4155 RepID=A0A022RPP8_ERYGU|nr:hypothetical protein MIMGU_mgv1a017378mg [Erythranthe guttata]
MKRELQRTQQLVSDVRFTPHQLHIKHLISPLLLHNRSHPLRQFQPVYRLARRFSRQQLQHYHTKAEHVGFRGPHILPL